MPHSTCYRHKGLTLVEVVCSIALVGALLISSIVGFSAHARRITSAASRSGAIQLLERMIAEWFAADEFPRNRSGQMAEQPHLRWETTVWQTPGLDASWLAETLRVEVIDTRKFETREVLASVELVIERKPTR